MKWSEDHQSPERENNKNNILKFVEVLLSKQNKVQSKS